MSKKGTVWSTDKVNKLFENYNKTGIIPADNPFFMGDMDLRNAKIAYEYTQEELIELAKISKDVVYYGENYAKVLTDSGIRTVKLRDYQIKALRHFVAFRYTVYLASRQIGKCVTFDTHVVVDGENTPIYKVHYSNKKSLNFLDRIEFFLFGLLYKLKQKIKS